MKLNSGKSLISRTLYVPQPKGGKPLPVVAGGKMAEFQEDPEKGTGRHKKSRSPNQNDLSAKRKKRPEIQKDSIRDFSREKKLRSPNDKGIEDKIIHNEAAPRVFSAEFAVGATGLDQVPQDDLPHIAFFGRSNVGKSSILSALMGKRGLVKISSAPGKTREINFFRVNNAFYFVDLPGIGYAKVSIDMRNKMAAMIREYVEQCANLRGIVYLVDMRLAGTPLDLETVEILRSLGKPVLLVANKRDKLSQGDAGKASREIRSKFGLDEAPLAVSALTQAGFDALWENILEAVAVEG